MQRQRKNSKAAMRAAPTTEPITIPAMAPPDKRCDFVAATGVLVGDEVTVAVEVGRLRVAVMDGKTTPAQRVDTFEV